MSASSTSETSSAAIFPTPTSPPNNNTTPPQSSSLYLFTFLATLLLLLAVSCAIVIRSFILRRRFRRRIEEAIAAGVLIPGALEDGPGGRGMGRGRRRDFGEKPKLWEVWVDEHGHVHDNTQDHSSEGDNFGKGEGKWEEILPVSAAIVSSNAPKPIPLPGSGSATSLPTSVHQDAHRRFIPRFLGRRPLTASSPPPAQDPPLEHSESPPQLELTDPPSVTSRDSEKDDEKLQISVLISMPNPNSRKLYGSDAGGTGSDDSVKGKGKEPGSEDPDGETEIPDVVFGVAEAPYNSRI